MPVSSPKEAELTKLLENTFRHVNIALVNELAMFAADLGIDVWEAIDAASTKPFGYMRFTPGPGVGGHCLPIDPCYLSWRVKRRLGHSRSASSSWPTTSTTTCPTTSCAGSRSRSTRSARRSTARGSCCSAWRTRRTPATPGVAGHGRRRTAARARRRRAGRRPARARRAGRRPHRSGRAHRRARSRADAVVLLVDHDAFDLADLVELDRSVRARYPQSAERRWRCVTLFHLRQVFIE